MSAVMASNPSSGQYSVCFTAVPSIPHIVSGDDVAQLLFDASNSAGLQISTLLKIFSKSIISTDTEVAKSGITR